MRNLKSPPIKEAVVALTTNDVSPSRLTELMGCKDRLGMLAATVRPIRQKTVTVHFEGADNTHDEASGDDEGTELIGYRFESEDGSYVLQMKKDGVVVSQVKNYEGWEKFLDVARIAWGCFHDTCAPDLVKRTATRFINEIRVPCADKCDLEGYVNIKSALPTGIQIEPVSHLHQYTFRYSKDVNINLVEVVLQMQEENVIPVIVDTDVFTHTEYLSESGDFWNRLDEFRGIKNEMFIAHVTDKALKELFGGI